VIIYDVSRDRQANTFWASATSQINFSLSAARRHCWLLFAAWYVRARNTRFLTARRGRGSLHRGDGETFPSSEGGMDRAIGLGFSRNFRRPTAGRQEKKSARDRGRKVVPWSVRQVLRRHSSRSAELVPFRRLDSYGFWHIDHALPPTTSSRSSRETLVDSTWDGERLYEKCARTSLDTCLAISDTLSWTYCAFWIPAPEAWLIIYSVAFLQTLFISWRVSHNLLYSCNENAKLNTPCDIIRCGLFRVHEERLRVQEEFQRE